MYSKDYPVRSMADATPNARAQFIRRTYAHLALAIAAFIGLEAFLLSLEPVRNAAISLLNSGGLAWLGLLGGFIVIGWVARSFASGSRSKPAQYLGLGLYVVAEALIFVPLLILAQYQAAQMGAPQNTLIGQAGIVTLLLVAGLTATVFITRKDFSFLGSFLAIGGMVAFGLIIAGAFFGGFNLGLWFSAGMVILAAGMILYTTSNILHHYGEDQYVAASLELFAAVAVMFWYVLRIFMSRD